MQPNEWLYHHGAEQPKRKAVSLWLHNAWKSGNFFYPVKPERVAASFGCDESCLNGYLAAGFAKEGRQFWLNRVDMLL